MFHYNFQIHITSRKYFVKIILKHFIIAIIILMLLEKIICNCIWANDSIYIWMPIMFLKSFGKFKEKKIMYIFIFILVLYSKNFIKIRQVWTVFRVFSEYLAKYKNRKALLLFCPSSVHQHCSWPRFEAVHADIGRSDTCQYRPIRCMPI